MVRIYKHIYENGYWISNGNNAKDLGISADFCHKCYKRLDRNPEMVDNILHD